MIRINAGCGDNKLEGWINVDLHGEPDVRCDLEDTPWAEPKSPNNPEPQVLWQDSSVDEMNWNHSLEHIGFHPDTFISVIKEIYRVCKPNAKVSIAVPHPRHDNFINDPTHVRIITPEVMALFSKKQCAEVKRLGGANSPLATYHDVDFQMESCQIVLDPRYEYIAGRPDEQMRLKRQFNNVASEYRMIFKVIKDA